MTGAATQPKTLELSPEGIEAFLDQLRRKGRSGGTVEKYRHDLTALYEFLPEEKRLDKYMLPTWQTWMTEQGYALRTVNSRLSAANSFVAYIGRRDLQVLSLERPEDTQPELTRQEYLRLLSTAKALGKERLYLLIKLFGTVGVPMQELPAVTVESVKSGGIVRKAEVYRVPGSLQKELLSFAKRSGIASGPLFLSKTGQPLRRTYVTDSIRNLCEDARVAPEKANPRCLQRLCRETKANMEREIARLVEQSYEHLLETEQLTIGWDETMTGAV